ncbi:olfactory receptor 6M1-like [Hyla sarda]|uniref:olfactory receptor 6M1-like n=1 Tax=Hyla sarda TaxID=327740 RepID=UPI0024C2EB97|nr:olfactory receptor 6M1-like [Hyla sarda]
MADNSSKFNLCGLPFEPGRLFGSELDKIMEGLADKKGKCLPVQSFRGRGRGRSGRNQGASRPQKHQSNQKRGGGRSREMSFLHRSKDPVLEWRNTTRVAEFILLGLPLFSNNLASFVLIIVTYIFTMAGNFLILFLVFSDQRLQSPMYFFLCNLSILDICFINTTIPKMLHGYTPGGKTISVPDCLMQSYSFFLLGVANFLLLAVMSLDRYVAICYPLHYSTIMHQKQCVKLIVAVWAAAFFSILGLTIRIVRLPFCSKLVNHFFCDVIPLLKNACVNTAAIHLQEIITSSIILLTSLFVTLASYINIVRNILKIQSVAGRQKAFSTCSSHALVVSLAYGSSIFSYIKPSQGQIKDYDKKVALLTTIIVPLLNPFIYTLRNQKVKSVLKEKLRNRTFVNSIVASKHLSTV